MAARPTRRARSAALALALAAASACRGDPALGRHVDHPAFDGDLAWSFLTEQVAFGPRIAGTKAHDRALAWLADELRFRADTVERIPFDYVPADGKRAVMTDLLARWNPRSPRRILLLAHWDTHPRADESADPYDRRFPVPGANDGASGTALLLALAQALHEQRPADGVDLLFTDGDDHDDGVWMGTRTFLREHPRYRAAFALVVDVVADREGWLPQDAGSRRHAPAVVRRVWGIARQMRRDSLFAWDAQPDSDGAHLLLSRAGIPAARVNDPELGPGNSWLHTTRDLPGNASRETLAMAGEVITETVYRGVPER